MDPITPPTSQTEIDTLQRRVDGLEELLRKQFHPAPEEPQLNLRFITIRRTTDIAAFVALMLSLLAMIFQLQSFLSGPDLRSFPPRQVVIYNSDLLKSQADFGTNTQVLFAAITSYSNRASRDHPAIVTNEFIRVKIGNTKVQHWLYAVGNSLFRGPFGIEATVSRPVPFGVDGNNGFAHDVLFQPLRYPYCLPADAGCAAAKTWYSWADFMTDLSAARVAEVTLGAALDNQTPVMVGCTLRFSDDDLNILGSEGHLATTCE